VPLAMVAGYAFEEIHKQARAKQSRIALAVAVTIATALIGLSGYQMAKLNFVHYDDDRYVYSYSHTHRDIFPMLDEIDRLSKRAGTGSHTTIHFAAREWTDNQIVLLSRRFWGWLRVRQEGCQECQDIYNIETSCNAASACFRETGTSSGNSSSKQKKNWGHLGKKGPSP